MKQTYHTNARTNIHNRATINKNSFSNKELSERFEVSKTTVSKWKGRSNLEDKSSRPHKIEYALNDIEQALIVTIRKSSWLPLDEIFEMVLEKNPSVSRSSVYRTLCRNSINTVPEKEKEKAQKFKEYEPGYLHLDVTYLPKIDGIKHYLFVGIDRCTRAMHYGIYDAKTSNNTLDFIKKCQAHFPFKMTHILTDNGLEFTNRLLKSKKGAYCAKPSKLDEFCSENNIDHRLTKPGNPQTNGMVERVNGTIKNATIKINEYENKQQMEEDLVRFLKHYNIYRRHGSLRRELNVKTPCDAIEKWYRIKPEIFWQNPKDFYEKLISL